MSASRRTSRPTPHTRLELRGTEEHSRFDPEGSCECDEDRGAQVHFAALDSLDVAHVEIRGLGEATLVYWLIGATRQCWSERKVAMR